MEQTNFHEYNKLVSFYTEDQIINGEADLQQVELLLEKYPFCQSLSLMYAAQLKGDHEKFKKNLVKASLLSPQREVLYRFIHQPERFKVSTERYLSYHPFQNNKTEPQIVETETLYVDTDVLTGSTIDPPSRDEEPLSVIKDIDDKQLEAVDSEVSHINTEVEVINNDDSGYEVEKNRAELSEILEEQHITASVDDEPVDEIIKDDEEMEAETIASDQTTIDDTSDQTEFLTEEPTDSEYKGEEDLLLNNIIASDYFVFEKSVVDPLKSGDNKAESVSAMQIEDDNRQNEQVSNYNDDKLPYTFLWWLDKTRREHADTYQPYVNFKLDNTQPIGKNTPVVENESLNHQIIENIFHQQIPLPLSDKLQAPVKDGSAEKTKDQEIIEKFIQQEPQIRHPQLENIDNENKARKSAEDSNDLVSGTLASIYIDQMLYQKAIDTYKKLSLKFPEKSAYFADQTSSLQKRIN